MHISPIFIYYLLATCIFGLISLISMAISMLKYNNTTASPYMHLMSIFGSLCIVSGSKCILPLWWSSRYAKNMPKKEFESFFISMIIAVIGYLMLFYMIKWSVVNYKKYVKDKQSNLSDNEK